VQAATVNWGVNAIQNSPDNTVGAGWIVQVFDSSVAYDYAKAVAGEITPWVSGSAVAAGTTFRAAGSTTMDNDSTKNIYAVIYDATSIADAKNYVVSDVLTITANAAGSTVPATFGSMAGTGTGKLAGYAWTATAVPEPTSGLLMLLGVAGLALKRKRA
jgi:hypothetical protein